MSDHAIAVILHNAADLCEVGWCRRGVSAIRHGHLCYSAEGALLIASQKDGERFNHAAFYLRSAIGTHNITIWNGRLWRRRKAVVKALRNAAVAAWRAGE